MLLLTAGWIVYPHIPLESITSQAALRATAYTGMTLWLAILLWCQAAWVSKTSTGDKRLHLPVLVLGLVLLIAGSLGGIRPVGDIGKIIFAATIGVLIARSVQNVLWVPIVACAAAAADMWSVLSAKGVTNTIIREHAEVIPWATWTVPVPGLPVAAHWQVGISDALFATFFLCTSFLWGLGLLRAAASQVLGIIGTLAFSSEVMEASALPAIPALVLCWMLFNSRQLVRELQSSRASQRAQRDECEETDQLE